MELGAGLLSVFSVLILGALRAGVAQELQSPPNRIAIVGAGIGGSSAAYFLRQKFGKDVQIDVFEKGEVGGRLATLEIGGAEYEAGGSILHPLNLHMKTFVKELGLSVRMRSDGLGGIYNGEEFVFQESSWFIINFVKMLWYYGLNSLRMYTWVEDMLDKFARIYSYQNLDYSFSTVERLLHSLGGDDFTTRLNTSIEETMLNSGFSVKYINDIVYPAMGVDFGQGLKINGFVGTLTLAGTHSGLWSVEGGNKRVCSGLIRASDSKLISGAVTSVEEKSLPKHIGSGEHLYELSYETSAGPQADLYDIVVMATPLNKPVSNIRFLGFHPPIEIMSKVYHQTVATYVHGKINGSFFGCPQPCQLELSDIITNNPKLFFSSIGAVSPVKATTESEASQPTGLKVWKVFSPEPLTKDQLKLLFESYEAVNERKWLAYPEYSPPEKMPPVILHDRIYYVNSIELAASAMEMSAISAKNVALLAHHRWYGKDGQIDQQNLEERLKSEL
ncbi:prenylcysteine oxidase 1-like [Spea bombifrons]|uniref:prenylcysteine oxidase 1-like n=1 Tax=Spea bombifrons TaxID=233779 RepID=UPI002349EBEC|nr:prenylcysteine oxidase 1-like [Spea bombifrons]